MPKHSIRSRSSTTRVARVSIAATLLFGILASLLPFATVASGPLCTLDCCAGRAPHAAGSCMNDSCHAFLQTHSKKTRVNTQLSSHNDEPMCGLAQAMRGLPSIFHTRNQLVTREHYPEPTDKRGIQINTKISSPAIGKPCQSDCASLASAASTSKRQRDKAAIAYADEPRPPSTTIFATIESSLIRERSELCRKCAPRGPPVSES
jgi:hypothetical protein